MSQALELIQERTPDGLHLSCPEVGLFTCAVPAGGLLTPGIRAGVLHALGRSFDLIVPPGVTGRVVNARPERVLAPVGHGSRLYELAPLEATAARKADAPSATAAGTELAFRAPYSGRFWQRPAPGEAAFVQAGDLLTEGRTLGLIEVMKTFTHLVYRAGGELPERARVVRLLVPDGGEVKDGTPLLELEPA